MNREYSKITNCIESSKTEKQFESCDRLIDIFEKRFYKPTDTDTEFMLSNLKVRLYKKKLLVN
jgi:hypothetical protein